MMILSFKIIHRVIYITLSQYAKNFLGVMNPRNGHISMYMTIFIYSIAGVGGYPYLLHLNWGLSQFRKFSVLI